MKKIVLDSGLSPYTLVKKTSFVFSALLFSGFLCSANSYAVSNISQGGLTWSSPNEKVKNWNDAYAYCASMGERLPTQAELSALYSSGVLAKARGWTLVNTWSSTPNPGVPGTHYAVNLDLGGVGWGNDKDGYYVTCVH